MILRPGRGPQMSFPLLSFRRAAGAARRETVANIYERARSRGGARARAVFHSTNRSSVLRCVLDARAGLCAPAPRNKNALGRIFGLGLPGPQLRLPIASGDSGVGKTASQRVCSKTAAFYFLSFIMVSALIHIKSCRSHNEW